MCTNQTTRVEINGQNLSAEGFGRHIEMNIKLIRIVMFITVVILVMWVMGKTSAHEATSVWMMFEWSGITQLVINDRILSVNGTQLETSNSGAHIDAPLQ